MFSNLSASIIEEPIDYPIRDMSLPFSEYISRSRTIIKERRVDLQQTNPLSTIIWDANCPFELYPTMPIYTNNRFKYGVLLIHGLLDGPFSLKDLGLRLQENGMLVRSILLPGHGTTPNDLLDTSYHDWIQAVGYGIASLQQEVEHIFLAGYSTGAALSIYHALQNAQIKGMILLAPAIKIRIPFDMIITWHYLLKTFSNNKQWLHQQKEDDYVKYQSIAFHPVREVSALTGIINNLHAKHPIACPIFMAVSREDETISSHTAIDFFSTLKQRDNQLLLYTAYDHAYADPRILTRNAAYPEFNIKHFSHVSIPFAPCNSHYGEQGDYANCSRIHANETIFGAYNHIEMIAYEWLYRLKFIKKRRRELTFNPDFDFMADKVVKFILGLG